MGRAWSTKKGKNMLPKVSVVIPCYNEEDSLLNFYQAICKTAENIKSDFEFIFVDDGSKDSTLAICRGLAKQDNRVRFISFSRNFGKEAAMYAGLSYAQGDYIAVMDADMQDPPSLLPEMYSLLTSENKIYDCVATRRTNRKGEPPIRSFFARCFYRLINCISKVDIVDGARDFRLMTRQMVDAILKIEESNRFSKGIFGWVGFQTKWIEYVNVERVAGETKWSFWKLLLYSLDGIIAFSTIPLALPFLIGLALCLIATIWFLLIAINVVSWEYSYLACLMVFIGGLTLLANGIVGQYLAKTYLETKHRPIYIVRETEQNL